jgi:hypothetical protein
MRLTASLHRGCALAASAVTLAVAAAGTAAAAPPGDTNTNVASYPIVDCGPFTGAVTIVRPAAKQGAGGGVMVFADGRAAVLADLLPAGQHLPGALIDCTVDLGEGTLFTARIFVPAV